MRRDYLPDLLYETLDELGGEATALETAACFWTRHDTELRDSGNLFYTWRCDLRQAADTLRREHRMVEAYDCPEGVWALVQ